jgi:hypothetical protein
MRNYVCSKLIKEYNGLVRKAAFQLSSHHGLDTPVQRQAQASFTRQIREAYPLNSYKLTWS